jgi:hypothetical protein
MKLSLSALTALIIPFMYAYDHKVIYSISTPRSCSTAFARMMEARGDCFVIHEPSMIAHELRFFPRQQVINSYAPGTPRSFKEVKEQIFKHLKKSHVLAKEISYAVRDFLFDNLDFVGNPVVYFVFLIRNPHHALISFYKKKEQQFNGNPLGYKQLYELLLFIKANGYNQPAIIFAEDMYEHPEEVAVQMCHILDIPFTEECLHWENLEGKAFNKENWQETKRDAGTLKHWHDIALKSTGFIKPSEYEVDEFGNPTFSEVTDEKAREVCKRVYEEELFYYQLMKLEYYNVCGSRS